MVGTDGFRVRVLGCGDAFGSGGRFQSAFLLEIGQNRVLMECGATTLVALQQARIDPGEIDLVLISHLHGDHFGGLPFLLLDQHFRAKRTRPLTIAGPPGICHRQKRLLALSFAGAEALRLSFTLSIEEIEADRPPRRLGPVEVRGVEVVHPSGAPSLGLSVQADGRRLAYSGDTEWTEALIVLAKNADLFICECYAFEPGLNRHMNYRTLQRPDATISRPGGSC